MRLTSRSYPRGREILGPDGGPPGLRSEALVVHFQRRVWRNSAREGLLERQFEIRMEREVQQLLRPPPISLEVEKGAPEGGNAGSFGPEGGSEPALQLSPQFRLHAFERRGAAAATASRDAGRQPRQELISRGFWQLPEFGQGAPRGADDVRCSRRRERGF